MHGEAWGFASSAMAQYQYAHIDVVEFGSRDVNGSPRLFFKRAASYTGVDIADGPGVDIVADAATWEPDKLYDLAICMEVFEHTPDWRGIVDTASKALKQGGLFVVTAASDPREPHSAVDGFGLRDDEYYGNVDPEDLAVALLRAGFKGSVVESDPRGDVYGKARR